MSASIIDAGPLVAMFDPSDQFHKWAIEQAKRVTLPWCTCEAVLTEAFFLLARVPNGKQKLAAALLRAGLIDLPWNLNEDRKLVMSLMDKYADTPGSYADMCLLRMAESFKSPIIWTTDEHFRIYRINGSHKIHTLLP